jgi:membrane protein required for colicin V production
MNWLDIVIIIFILISVVSGLMQGIVKILFSIIGLIVGVILAGKYSGALGEKLTFISDPNTAGTVSFVVIVLVVLIVATLIAFLVKKLISAVLLGWVDKIGGAVLGLFLGMIFAGAILTMYLKYFGPTDIITGSTLSAFLLDKFPVVMSFLPNEFDSVKSYFQ